MPNWFLFRRATVLELQNNLLGERFLSQEQKKVTLKKNNGSRNMEPIREARTTDPFEPVL